jgi:hypothetical protein
LCEVALRLGICIDVKLACLPPGKCYKIASGVFRFRESESCCPKDYSQGLHILKHL